MTALCAKSFEPYLSRTSNILPSKVGATTSHHFSLFSGVSKILKLHAVTEFLSHSLAPFLELPPVPADSKVQLLAVHCFINTYSFGTDHDHVLHYKATLFRQ